MERNSELRFHVHFQLQIFIEIYLAREQMNAIVQENLTKREEIHTSSIRWWWG